MVDARQSTIIVFIVQLLLSFVPCDSIAADSCASIFASGEAAYQTGIQLFTKVGDKDSIHAENYSELVSNLKPRSNISFSNGKSFQVEAIIKNGGTDAILRLVDGTVLRLQSGINKHPPISVNQFINGYDILRQEGVPTPKILSKLKSEYIKIEMDLPSFLERYDTLSSSVQKKMTDEFISFVKKFKNFDTVADFHAWQIAYSKENGWVLLDWRDRHFLGNSFNPFWDVFDSLRAHSRVPENRIADWEQLTDREILSERNMDDNFFSRQRTGYREGRYRAFMDR